MKLQITLPDASYQRLVSTGRRMRGSIGLVSPTEANFNEHVCHQNGNRSRYIKLRHGRASVGDKQVRLTLNIRLDEADVIPSCAIIDESRQASCFVDNIIR